VYPTLQEILSHQADKELVHIKRSLYSMIPGVIVFAFAVAVVLIAHTYLPAVSWIPVIRHVSPRWFALFPMIILLELTRRYHDNLYIMGKTDISRREGRLSLRYSTPSVRYRDIRGITVYQDFWGRIFGYGDVLLGTAARIDNELIIEDIDDPYDLAALIEHMRRHNLGTDDEYLNDNPAQ
jgi:hypothetical protein